jgi:hypothetical protein
MLKETTVESETLEAFLPRLVTAICDDIQRITDQCLASGLISGSGHRRILGLRGSNEDQARALIQCVQNSTKTDNRCFEIFLDCLDKELPRLIKEKLLPDIRKYLAKEDLEEYKRLLKEKEDERIQEEKARKQQVAEAQVENKWEIGKSPLEQFLVNRPLGIKDDIYKGEVEHRC